MAPARELALQIAREAKKFAGALGLTVACIYGKIYSPIYTCPIIICLLPLW